MRQNYAPSELTSGKLCEAAFPGEVKINEPFPIDIMSRCRHVYPNLVSYRGRSRNMRESCLYVQKSCMVSRERGKICGLCEVGRAQYVGWGTSRTRVHF